MNMGKGKASFIASFHCCQENGKVGFECLSLHLCVFEYKQEASMALEDGFRDYIPDSGLDDIIDQYIEPDFSDKDERWYVVKGDVHVGYYQDYWGEYDADFFFSNIDFQETEEMEEEDWQMNDVSKIQSYVQ